MDQTPPRTLTSPPLLTPGRNCWRIEKSSRLAFLVDGDAYFSAVRAAIARARRSVFILGWDIDSRMRLRPFGANDGLPEELGDFLNEVVKRRRDLHMYVLSWDFAMVFALDREWLPIYKLDWRTHRRLHFHLDDKHPLGASHHQKVVVIDDAVAFLGGLDLTHDRWDTPEHACNQPGRCDPDGKRYRPYHDVQVIVDGGAARALGELCRERWNRVSKRRPPEVDRSSANDPWPPGLAPEITNVDVAISRTDPGYATGHPVDEIRHLYVDAIAAAKRSMYLENQYFSSSVVGAALAGRLREAEGPDIVVVSRRVEEGWLEERTMGVLRARLHRQLKEADAGGRYRLYCPEVPGLEMPDLLNVHSKVLAVDDELVSVGSANFSNRSMGFDTECNIAIEARGEERIRRAVAGLRNRLLAEHLGTDAETVGAEIARQGGSLVKAIEALKRPGRTLEPIEPHVSPEIDALVPASAVVDPERPMDPEELVQEFVPRAARKPVASRVWRVAAALITLAALAAVWRWTPLRDWVALEALVRMARALHESPAAPIVVVAAYVIGGLLVVPVTALIVATGIVFGPLVGSLYAFAGVLLSAAVTYSIGRRMGRHAVRRLAGARLNRITRRLAKKGTVAIAVIRLLPIAPFSVVNAVAGASHIRLREFLLGTVLGMFPGIVATVVFVDRVAAVVTDPGLPTFLMLAAFILLIVAIALFVHRRLVRTGAAAAPRGG
jgi:phosphatidylserine/phosphatidylglycerophosphate/cardiolipin synthase-like enzyme/membrane protein DedA with SNARE-associated domain